VFALLALATVGIVDGWEESLPLFSERLVDLRPGVEVFLHVVLEKEVLDDRHESRVVSFFLCSRACSRTRSSPAAQGPSRKWSRQRYVRHIFVSSIFDSRVSMK